MALKKVFGPPGSGKTTYLLNIVQQELAEGTSPPQVGYFAFTRKAANEAKERAVAKFPHLNEDMDFPWFRTLHSLAYRCLGVSQKDMMKPANYREFAKEAGIEIGLESDDEDISVKANNPILNQIGIARTRGEDLRVHYNKSGMDIEWFHFEYVERAYRHYKHSKELLDFTDLLERVLEDTDRLPSLDVVIIDEAQDLSPLQWKLVKALVERSNRAYIAGDDDQAVYTWAGADVASFLSLEGDITVLAQSYRVPAKIHNLANRVIQRVHNRQPKEWMPRQFDGEIYTYNGIEYVDVTHGEWLILAATNYMLNDMHQWLKSEGILFERHGHRSIPEKIVNCVLGWETLRKGEQVHGSVVRNIYKHLDPSFIARGHKSLPTLDDEGLYTLEDLKQSHGLLTDAIWHQALTKIDEGRRDYIIALLRRGTRITGKAHVKLSTIHGAKGGEADNVLLMMDLSSRFSEEYYKNPDDLNRLAYVGITRARQSLHLVLPKNQKKAFVL